MIKVYYCPLNFENCLSMWPWFAPLSIFLLGVVIVDIIDQPSKFQLNYRNSVVPS